MDHLALDATLTQPVCVTAAQLAAQMLQSAEVMETHKKFALRFQGSPVPYFELPVNLGDTLFMVNNTGILDVPAEPAAAKKRKTDEHDDTLASDHESANRKKNKKVDMLTCVKCAQRFNRDTVEKIYGEDFDAHMASAAPLDNCWHCRGVCCRSTCVKIREGKTAKEITAILTGKSKSKAVRAAYFASNNVAKAAGFESVRAHVKATDATKSW